MTCQASIVVVRGFFPADHIEPRLCLPFLVAVGLLFTYVSRKERVRTMGTIHTVADEALEFLDAIDLLLSEAKCSEEQRAELRVQFFRPVSVSIRVPEPQQVSAICRDLSPFGVGLLHSVPLDPQEAVVHRSARARWKAPSPRKDQVV